VNSIESAQPDPAGDPAGHSNFHQRLGIRRVPAPRGQGRIELVVGPEHLRSRAIAHGGVLASLLDAACGMAAGSLAPEGHDVVTVQLNVNFIRPAWPGEALHAHGQVEHAGRRTAVARARVETSNGQLVALGSATLMYLPLTPGPFAPPTTDSERS
jgi:uncharacterized protein (TIGR00369 family)